MTLLAHADLSEIAFRLCSSLRPLPGHATLLDALRREGGPDFAPRVSRGGWYRPGRILDADGSCVADDALAWLDEAWAAADADGDRLIEQLSDRQLILTREQGITHYLVAVHGTRPCDYFQLEVEELQEVISHPLGMGLDGVDAVEDLLERPTGLPAPSPTGPSRYSFRRVTDIAAQIATICAQAGKPPPVIRFLDEWAASSAGQHRHFSDHWVLALSEHLDRYRQTRFAATPVAGHAMTWKGDDSAAGAELAHLLYDYDRNAGYGFAWYFQMVSGRKVPRGLPARVHADLQGDMAYLPERDAALVARWVAEPYCV